MNDNAITDKELQEIEDGMRAGQVSLSAGYVKKILARLKHSESRLALCCPSCGKPLARETKSGDSGE